jgi:hypothetical protein
MLFDAIISNTGGGGSHTHPFSVPVVLLLEAQQATPALDVKYANVIIAAKDA